MGILDKLRAPEENLEITDPTKQIPCKSMKELMYQKLEARDEKDQMFFNHSTKGLTGFCILSSMYMNTLVRKSLLLYEGFIYTTVAVATLTSISNYMGQYGLVQLPLVDGKLNCSSCATTRGAMVQAVCGCLLPGALSFSLSAILADRYKSAAVPELTIPPSKEFRVFWKKAFSGMKTRVIGMILIQAAAGAFIGYKEHKIVQEMRQTITPEEHRELWKEAMKTVDSILD